jgi:hypothetical protein
MTIIKTFRAVINGKSTKVETLLASYSRTDISYRVGNETLSYEAFWELSPKVKG